MKKITSGVFIWLILFSFSGMARSETPVEPQRLTFEEALQMTLQNNFLIRQSDHHLRQMEMEMGAAKGLRMPRVSLNANYSMMGDRIHFDLSPVRDAITPLYQTLGSYGVFSGVPNPDPSTSSIMPILPDNISTQAVRKKMLEGLQTVQNGEWDLTIQEKQFATLNAGFIWPLFTGGKINAANKAARIKYEAVSFENLQKSYELTNELIDRYFGLVLASQAMKVREEVKSTMKKHFEDAENLQKQGQVANVEVLNAKLYLADAEREWQKSVRQIDILNEALLNTLAAKNLQSPEPVTALFYRDSIESVDYFYAKAMEKSPLLAQVTKKKELAEQGYLAEKSGHLPSFAVTGMYDLANKDLSPYLPGYVVGVGMKWNLFEGLSQTKKVAAAGLQKLEAEDYYQKAAADIRTAINKHYQELNMYREQLHMLDAAMNLAVEYYRVRNKAFSEGMATTTQVADASLLLAKARIDRLQAMYGYDVSLSRLLYYAGLTDQFVQYMSRPGVVTEHPEGSK
ncbi:MAG: TolC family protein [Marinilabiliales bacterium]|nr:TolC family protein [Marinilabiliales bacterium]